MRKALLDSDPVSTSASFREVLQKLLSVLVVRRSKWSRRASLRVKASHRLTTDLTRGATFVVEYSIVAYLIFFHEQFHLHSPFPCQ